MRAMMIVALLVLPLAAWADDPPPAKAPPEHTLHLSDSDLQTITWFVTTYGGEHCGSGDGLTVYCTAALQGRELVLKLQAQAAAETRPAKVKR